MWARGWFREHVRGGGHGHAQLIGPETTAARAPVLEPSCDPLPGTRAAPAIRAPVIRESIKIAHNWLSHSIELTRTCRAK